VGERTGPDASRVAPVLGFSGRLPHVQQDAAALAYADIATRSEVVIIDDAGATVASHP
jgi:hypothetical protein